MKHRMSRLQRAKQFMPFAALKGFETLLSAVARLSLIHILLISNEDIEAAFVRLPCLWIER